MTSGKAFPSPKALQFLLSLAPSLHLGGCVQNTWILPAFRQRIKEDIEAPQRATPHVIRGPAWSHCLEELHNTRFQNSPRRQTREAEEQDWRTWLLLCLVFSLRPPAVCLHLGLLGGHLLPQLQMSRHALPRLPPVPPMPFSAVPSCPFLQPPQVASTSQLLSSVL